MSVLKVKKDSVWEEVGGISDHTHTTTDITNFPSSLPADGGNADTVDGKHASDFAAATDMTTAQSDISDLQTKVGDLSGLNTVDKSSLVAAINEAAKSGGGGAGIVIDSTLTKSGQAADAAAVGNRLSALSDDITIPEKLPNPNALTFTGAVTGSYDGAEPLTVNIPSSGGGISAFEKIGTIDLSTMAGSNLVVEFTVTDVTEIVLIWTGMTNTTTSNSSLLLAFNSIDYYNTLGPRTGKAGTPQNGYTYLKVLENVGVLPIVSAGAKSNTNYTQGGSPCSYNLIPVKEKIQKILIKQPSTQYYADAGIVEVYVR